MNRCSGVNGLLNNVSVYRIRCVVDSCRLQMSILNGKRPVTPIEVDYMSLSLSKTDINSGLECRKILLAR